MKCTRYVPCLLLFFLASSMMAKALTASNAAKIKQQLQAASALELPATAANALKKAQPGDRDQILDIVISFVASKNPGSMAAVVASIASAQPEIAAKAASKAADAVPSWAASIFATAQKSAPKFAKDIAEQFKNFQRDHDRGKDKDRDKDKDPGKDKDRGKDKDHGKDKDDKGKGKGGKGDDDDDDDQHHYGRP